LPLAQRRRRFANQYKPFQFGRVVRITMKKLLLMRHAKSSWDDPALTDHDRPLTPRGRKGAALIAEYLQREGLEPSIVLCTSATRARETLERLRPSFSDSTIIKIEPKLYGAGSKELMTRIRRLSQASQSVLIIGHNPAIQELVLALVPNGPKSDAIRKKFPTAALAILDVSIDEWRRLKPGEASLESFVTPNRLR
jgi:phosphohistidine phosphatase